MKIVHAASELFPYMKTGGLADAVGSLTGTLADHGHEVSVFLPGYGKVLEHAHAAGALHQRLDDQRRGRRVVDGEVALERVAGAAGDVGGRLAGDGGAGVGTGHPGVVAQQRGIGVAE